MITYRLLPLKCPHCEMNLPIWDNSNEEVRLEEGIIASRYCCKTCGGVVYISANTNNDKKTENTINIKEIQEPVVYSEKEITEETQIETIHSLVPKKSSERAKQFVKNIKDIITAKIDNIMEQYNGTTYFYYDKDGESFNPSYCKRCGSMYTYILADKGNFKRLDLDGHIDRVKGDIERANIEEKNKYTKKGVTELKCMICRDTLRNGFFADVETASGLSRRIIEYEDKEIDKEIEKTISEYIENGKTKYLVEANATHDNIDVKSYVSHLVNLEKNIMFLSSVLKKYIEYLLDLEQSSIRRKAEGCETSNLRRQIEDLEYKYPILSLTVADSDIHLSIPKEPEYEIPGIFNKRKIEAENEQKKKHFMMQLAVYKDTLQKKKEEEISRRREQNEKNKERIEQERAILEEKIRQEDEHNDTSELKDFIMHEIDDARCKLCELCEIKGKMLNLNVIYPKYLEFMTLSTIDDYLKSGRVSELEGPYGAYNLYENELRSNIIISQLDTVINELEQIKNNQYTTYCILSEMKNDTKAIKNSLIDIKNNVLEDISRNTAITAYNSNKIAKYSKINAELTGAIAFMMAF